MNTCNTGMDPLTAWPQLMLKRGEQNARDAQTKQSQTVPVVDGARVPTMKGKTKKMNEYIVMCFIYTQMDFNMGLASYDWL